ncbi:hydrogenase subunit MbhD domain-containing protein, partial [Listeria monocytogenes]|uniref:hydrogenase subunit MbhD domain-containing protein n=1 Tax=Listeria monocytogenes TaxID=1639 RepID=UPI000AF43CA5
NGMYYLEQGSFRMTMFIMPGWPRTYLHYLLSAFILMMASVMIFTQALDSNFSSMTKVMVVDFVLAAAILVILVGVVFSQLRITSLYLLLAKGYPIRIFFVISRAPDLALTPLIFYTISVVLYLLVVYHLP